MAAVLVDRVARAIEAGADALFRRQRPDGAFTDDPPASVLGTAGAITALHAADPEGSAELVRGGVTWLLDHQLADGGWGGVVGAPGEPVATAVASAALRIVTANAGGPAGEGGRWAGGSGRDGGTGGDGVGAAGGVDGDGGGAARVEGAVGAGVRWLAGVGGVEAVTDRAVNHLCRQFLALAGLPGGEGLRRLPLEIVLFDGVRRQRISFRTTPFIGMALLQAGAARGVRRWTVARARVRALQLLEEVYEHEGRTGAFSEDPWPAALVCLGLARAGVAPHLVTAIAGFLRRSVREDGSWDAVTNLDLTRSAFATTGLVAAGYGGDARLVATVGLFRHCQQDRAFPVFGCPAGGWSYNGPHGWPVTLESAEILTALAVVVGREDPAVERGIGWLLGRQDGRGSWSLWVRDTKLANDGPCPGITSQAIEALVAAGHQDSEPVRSATRWLLGAQREDGSFHNLWYRDHTTGTAVVLDALARAGLTAEPGTQRAMGWLLAAQLPDGSWGTGPGHDGPGTVEETAWATHALITAGRGDDEAVRRAVGWLLDAQRADGSWPPSRVCVYIRHLMHYPNGGITRGLAMRALGAYREHTAAAGR